jgi:molecular chaperone GrpE
VVVDDLERALGAAGDDQAADDAIVQGVRITHEHLMGLLRRNGVEPISAEGKPFDPDIHEAMMRQPTDEHEPMTVLHEVARGYLHNGKPLRAAKVVVAVEPEEKVQ